MPQHRLRCPKTKRFRCKFCKLPLLKSEVVEHLIGCQKYQEFRSAQKKMTLTRTNATNSPPKPIIRATPIPNHRLSFETLPFEILPAGTHNVDAVVAFLRSGRSGLKRNRRSKEYQESCIQKIHTLGPSGCFKGRGGSLGYVIFEFKLLGRAILERPVENNATYVLSGDWKSMATHEKSYIRRNYAAHCRRVYHTEGWFLRLKSALGGW
jgi:hypothetical protein